MRQCWLVKTEPGSYSFADLEREGETEWDGVTNNLALKHLRTMRTGDLVFVYHSGKERAIVGLAEVSKDPYPDPRKNDPRWVIVDLRAKKKLARPVTLAEVKARPEFADFDLVRLPRLSVLPVEPEQWQQLLHMAGEIL